MDSRVIIDKTGLTFVPRFVKQKSDLEYGSLVTHEDYNEKLNLNTTQGDYNTEVLRILFTERDSTKAYHIPYLEKIFEDTMTEFEKKIDGFQEQIDTNREDIDTNTNNISDNATAIANIIKGVEQVGHAVMADKITSIDEAGNHYYYGTDFDGNQGFFELPEALFAEPVESNRVEVSGILYTPRPDSVDEAALTAAVRTKLNRTSITSYDELSNRPYINNKLLTGKLSLNDLGIQPAGNYLTAVPEEYALKSYVDTAVAPLMPTNTANSTFATITSLNNVQQTLNNSINNVTVTTANTYARIGVGGAPSNPKDGDLVIII